ncbi:hypothetical protein ACQZV8_01005 [Magnetococcales bacterium HHB-1]
MATIEIPDEISDGLSHVPRSKLLTALQTLIQEYQDTTTTPLDDMLANALEEAKQGKTSGPFTPQEWREHVHSFCL